MPPPLFAIAGLAVGLVLFAGILLFVRYARRMDRDYVKPLSQMRQCVEAAVKGDLSRVPDVSQPGEAGELGRAVGRLIQAFGRSENLIYHLATLVELSGEAIISYTLSGTILSWNNGAQRIYGFSADEMKGQPISILAPYDAGQEMMRVLRQLRRGEKILPFETQHQASNGRTIRAFIRVSAIYDSTRNVIGASFCAQELPAPVQTKAYQPSHFS